MEPANNVSPAMSFFSAGKYRQMLPSVCPGVSSTLALSEQSKVILVEQNRGAGGGAQLHRSAHVIDVSVSDDDLLDFEIMLAEDSENFVDVVAGIDHHGFARGFIPDDGAVAL
jgi:hypothetical protein